MLITSFVHLMVRDRLVESLVPGTLLLNLFVESQVVPKIELAMKPPCHTN